MRVFTWLAAAIVVLMFTVSILSGTEPAVLLTAAALTVVLGAAHSVLGEQRLIQPILRMDGLPRILGSVTQTKTVLRFAWHVTTLLWWGCAALMAYMAAVPGALSRPYLWMIAVVFAASGVIGFIATRGAHRSWVYFFSIAGLAAYAACRAV